MIYYYANTGHKIGLERLRRGASLLKNVTRRGEETQFLVNDFRAGLVLRDLGIYDYVTIEGVQDIDAIAEHGDSIIIDSVEDDHGRLVKYCEDFKTVWRFAHEKNDAAVHSEVVIDKDTVMVDDVYFEENVKEKRIVFFLGDADYNKTILGNEGFFKNLDMELLLGNYFFVKYEDDLARLFSILHEPEEYEELVKTSSTIVTASSQTALEAKVSGAQVIYVKLPQRELYDTNLLKSFGIDIVEGFDGNQVMKLLKSDTESDTQSIEKINVEKVLQL